MICCCVGVDCGNLYAVFVFFFQAEDGIRDVAVTGVQTCALPIWRIMMVVVMMMSVMVWEANNDGGCDDDECDGVGGE